MTRSIRPRTFVGTLTLTALTVAGLTMTGCAAGASAQDGGQGSDDGVSTLIVATGASPKPYTYLDENDELTGYDIEILKRIDEKLDDIAFEYEVAEFPALFAGLDSGRFNIVANNLSATDERREKYDFTDPYIEAQFGIVVPSDSGITEITTLDELAGKKTYGTPGLNFTKMLEQSNAENPSAEIDIEYTDLDQQLQFQNLAAGVVDFAFAERVVYQGYGEDQGLDLTFIPLDSDSLVETYGTNLFSAFAFSKATDQSDAFEAINTALGELLADGTVAELSAEFFDGLDVTPDA